MLNVLLNLVLNSVWINLSLWKLSDSFFMYGNVLERDHQCGGRDGARSWFGLEGSSRV